MGKREKTTAFFLPNGTLIVLSEYRGHDHASNAAMDSDAKL